MRFPDHRQGSFHVDAQRRLGATGTMPLLGAVALLLVALAALVAFAVHANAGAVTIAVALFAAFAFLYWRAFKARAAAESLAAEVRRTTTHLEQAQRVAGVGSWEWDAVAQRLTWSVEQRRLHGWTEPDPPQAVDGLLEVIAAQDRDRVATAIRTVLVDRAPVDLEYRVHETRGGRLIHVQASTVTDAHGRPVRVIGTCQDVTERDRRAEAERANQAKNQFISRMSHELRTPLNAILGFGQLMTMSDLDERQRGNIEHILSAGRHLLDLINEILDISRIESGDLRLALEPVSARSVIAETIDLVSPSASSRQIEVTAVLDADDLCVRADVQRLRQVLLNLFSNAVKYSDPGGHVRVRSSAHGEDRVRISVEDDGPGIPPAMIERLFSPFERLGAERSSVEGTGLGLALSRGMIEAMGGQIEVRSELGHGTAFTIELDSATGWRPPALIDPRPVGSAAPAQADSPGSTPATAAAR